ncbi:MAG: transcriptional repressor [Syntrophaceae bacterium]|nr:transcriptional repressor [Syntrophaceae bacterium]
MRKTVQRNAIINYLKENTSHPTVNDIYQTVSKEISSISLTTVYNTLYLLKQEGIIRELVIPKQDCKRYDANVLPHSHLICQKCSKIIDADLSFQSGITEEQKQSLDFQTEDVYIYGLCSSCKSKRNDLQPFLTIVQKSTHLHFIVTGENTKENVLKCLKDIHRVCVERNSRRILIESHLSGKCLQVLDIHEIVSSASNIGAAFYKAIALVIINSDKKLMKFAEDVAVNRALIMSVFSTVEEAETWLNPDKDKISFNLNKTEMEDSCKELMNAFEGVLSWKWDNRFETVLAEFGVEKIDNICEILKQYFSTMWNRSSIKKAPDTVQRINVDLNDLWPGQLLFTTDTNRDAFVYCAWWPWKNGKTISLRVAPFYKELLDSELEKDVKIQQFKGWFGI